VDVASINPSDPRPDRLERAVERLRGGEVLAVPTETFYGLCADSRNGEALARVNRLKGKPVGAPILLLLADAGQVDRVSGALPAAFESLAAAFWPGPLTLVVPAAPGLAPEIGGERGTVAVRVPGLVLPRRIAQALGAPIAGVSANRYREPPCRTAPEVADAFSEGLSMILDGGPCPGGAPSTIVDLCASPARIVRQGILPAVSLRPFLPGSL